MIHTSKSFVLAAKGVHHASQCILFVVLVMHVEQIVEIDSWS
jgi:hypothetical protein